LKIIKFFFLFAGISLFPLVAQSVNGYTSDFSPKKKRPQKKKSNRYFNPPPQKKKKKTATDPRGDLGFFFFGEGRVKSATLTKIHQKKKKKFFFF